jgi:hypothetical protein
LTLVATLGIGTVNSSVYGSPWRFCSALALLVLASGTAVGLEVTGVVHGGIALSGPTTKSVIVDGAAIRFSSENEPAEVYADSTDREGRYKIELDQGGTFRVTIDAYKMVPFDRAGTQVSRDTTLNFALEEDTREGVVFLKEGQRQLFLDNQNVEEIRSWRRTMHQPQKKGAVIRPDWPEWPPGDAEAVLQTRSAAFWDPLERIFKLWLRDGSYRTSLDGLHWLPGPEGVTGGEVFFDPLDPDPERRYKLFHPRRMSASPDGRSWTRVNTSITSSDEWNFSIDLENRLYIATVKMGGPYGRAVYLTTSRNFDDWTTPELIFHADYIDQVRGRQNVDARLADRNLVQPRGNDPRVYNVDAYNMGVFRYESVYLGMPTLYHAVAPVPNYPNTDGFHMVQLTASPDLKTWTRLGDRQPFIGPSLRDSGAYDLTQIIGPSNALVRGDELWFYYTGIKYRTAALKFIGTYPGGYWIPRPGFEFDSGAICLAVLRRDGFFSLDASGREGEVLTKPLVWRGSTLWVNVGTRQGEVQAELLDEEGNLIRQGWSRAHSIPATEDGVRLPMRWQNEEDLSELHQQTVRLRFYVRDAELYAFWSE